MDFKKLFASCAHAKNYAKFRPFLPAKVSSTILKYHNGGRKKVDQCVDICCAGGQSTLAISDTARRVVGVDSSEAQIQQARQRNKVGNVEYIVADATNLPFPNKSVDIISCCQAAQWLDINKLFRECDRVLNSNGTLVIYGYWYPCITLLHGNLRQEELLSKQQKSIELTNLFFASLHVPECEKKVLNKYEDIYRLLPSSTKHRVDDYFIEDGKTLFDFCGFITSLSGYNVKAEYSLQGKYTTDLEKYISRLLSIWDAEHVSPEDIHVSIKWDLFYVMSKRPFV